MSGSLYGRLCAPDADESRSCIRLPEGGVISYADLRSRSARYANALLDLGVEPGDRLLVQADKSAEMICLYLGCLRAGAVFLPLNTAYTLAELEYFIADAQPRVVVCTPGKLAAMLPLAQRLGVAQVVTLGAGASGGTLTERASVCEPLCFDVPREDADVAAILYTSGPPAARRARCSRTGTWPRTRLH